MVPPKSSICTGANEFTRSRILARHRELHTCPEPDRIFVFKRQRRSSEFRWERVLRPVGELNFKNDADNIRFDEATKKIYIGFGGAEEIAVVMRLTGNRSARSDSADIPKPFQLEKGGNRIFVNVPNSRHVAVVDRDRGEVIATWKTNLAFGNFPMALDEANHRLFVGCRLSLHARRAQHRFGRCRFKNQDFRRSPDDLFYDSKGHRIHVICGAGKIDVMRRANRCEQLQTFN